MVVRIAFIGLGAMGSRMVPHLADSDVELLIHDLDAVRAAEVAGQLDARALDDAASAASADLVFLMLPTSDVVESVLLGGVTTPGLLAALGRGSYVVDMSSSDPLRTRDLAVAARRHGVHLVDAPVSGGIVGAENARLAIMVGSEESEFRHVEPYLRRLGQAVSHVGEVGSGHAVKALNNLLGATVFAATAEAFTAAERFGLDPIKLREAVDASSGGSYVTRVMWPQAIESGDYFFGFRLSLMAKDVRIGSSLLVATDTQSPICDRAAEVWDRILAESAEDADMAEVARATAQQRRSDHPAVMEELE